MSHSGSITVAVRVRPPTEWEATRLPEPSPFESFLRGEGTLSSPRKINSSNVRNIVDIVDDRILTFDPPERDIAKAFSERGFVPPGSKRYKDRRFMFDRVFDGQARQMYVYENTTQALLDGLLDGYNSTVFAYGATGCGKTYTISGADDDPGIIYLAMADLFQRIEERKEEKTFEVVVTFLEIYNEEIRDLLAEPGSTIPKGGLAIREDKNVKVVNLTELRPLNADEVKGIVLLGNQRRTQSPTHANETSSRSHAVLQVHVTQSPRTASTTETRTMATLSIIDLAGSERASATKNMGDRMIEGANINKSLLALGNCINALCESGGTTRHVPYRNSKLTRLLKFSLGGNCKTVMIVCVAPTSIHFEDTHNALVYAERATKIKTKVVTRNVLNVNRHVGQYVEAINRLNEEVSHLKAKLADRQAGLEDSAKQKRGDILKELNRVKSDVRYKIDQNKPSIGEGARCQALLDIAGVKFAAIRERAQSAHPEGSMLQAERLFLSSLSSQQEAILQADSNISSRLQKFKNVDSLLDAALRAVGERRAIGKLDEIGTQNVQLLVSCGKHEVQQHRMEERCRAYEEALHQQTSVLVGLSSLLARCTVVLREGAKVVSANSDSTAANGNLLESLADTVDQGVTDVLGFGVARVSESSDVVQSSARRPIWTIGSRLQAPCEKARRPSTLNSSPKKLRRSPRKSRTSISVVRAPVKRESEKKSVRWKEDVSGTVNTSLYNESIIAMDKNCSNNKPRNAVSVGSESEWEDEKTEESVPVASGRTISRKSLGQRRTRNSRLDPVYLRTKEPPLESLIESGDEVEPAPFSDKINYMTGMESNGRKLRATQDERFSSKSQRSSRRLSSIGPMRSSRNRRRSSILLETRGAGDENTRPSSGANESRLLAMRRKRPSGCRTSRPLTVSTTELSSDASFRGIKPMWR